MPKSHPVFPALIKENILLSVVFFLCPMISWARASVLNDCWHFLLENQSDLYRGMQNYFKNTQQRHAKRLQRDTKPPYTTNAVVSF